MRKLLNVGKKDSGGSCSDSVQMLPNMFNRCAMYAEETCESALVYPVVAEQEELLSLSA